MEKDLRKELDVGLGIEIGAIEEDDVRMSLIGKIKT